MVRAERLRRLGIPDALPPEGKRGSARTLVATQRAGRWVFIHGFNKNERANIDAAELKVLQELARDLPGLDESGLAMAVAAGELLEVRDGSQQA